MRIARSRPAEARRKRDAVAAKVAAGCFAIGCAAPAAALGGAPRADVPVYDQTQIAFDRYVVVSRVGVQDWHSALRIRGYPDLQSAQEAVLAAAARVGADGVINLTCFDQTDRMFNPAGYFCYGNAIRLKQ